MLSHRISENIFLTHNLCQNVAVSKQTKEQLTRHCGPGTKQDQRQGLSGVMCDEINSPRRWKMLLMLAYTDDITFLPPRKHQRHLNSITSHPAHRSGKQPMEQPLLKPTCRNKNITVSQKQPHTIENKTPTRNASFMEQLRLSSCRHQEAGYQL